MFGKNNDKDENENSQNSAEDKKDKSEGQANPERVVLVTSKTLLDSKIIVIYKKIKSQNGKLRDVFNIYSFTPNSEEGRGEVLMPERDAILFWKDRTQEESLKDDVRVFTQEGDFEYDFKESKNLYKIEIESPENSEQRA
jgi:hypothetical protein